MATTIASLLDTIKNAVYGKDMRSALHDSIEATSDKVIYYTNCSSSKGATTKVITCAELDAASIKSGTRVSVVFDNGNTSAYFYLNVNGVSKSTYFPSGTSRTYSHNDIKTLITAGIPYDFVFQGDKWVFCGCTNIPNDGSISTAKLTDGCVTTNKLENGSVTGEKLDSGAVTADKIGKNAVIGEKIMNGTITSDKLDPNVLSNIGSSGSDGVGISSISTSTSSADGGSNTVTIYLTNGTSKSFTIKNGSQGNKGDTGESGAEATYVVSTLSELKTAISNISSNGKIVLKEGTYNLGAMVMTGKSITFIGRGDVTLKHDGKWSSDDRGYKSYPTSHYSLTSDIFTFRDLSVVLSNAAKNSDDKATLKFYNCKISSDNSASNQVNNASLYYGNGDFLASNCDIAFRGTTGSTNDACTQGINTTGRVVITESNIVTMAERGKQPFVYRAHEVIISDSYIDLEANTGSTYNGYSWIIGPNCYIVNIHDNNIVLNDKTWLCQYNSESNNTTHRRLVNNRVELTNSSIDKDLAFNLISDNVFYIPSYNCQLNVRATKARITNNYFYNDAYRTTINCYGRDSIITNNTFGSYAISNKGSGSVVTGNIGTST